MDLSRTICGLESGGPGAEPARPQAQYVITHLGDPQEPELERGVEGTPPVVPGLFEGLPNVVKLVAPWIQKSDDEEEADSQVARIG